jgi:predicted GTPase
MTRKRVLILGAAGRDFHDFNVLFRSDPGFEVVAFTAQQIPHIADRRYPASLAGPLYPEGIPIVPEVRLETLIVEHDVDVCVMAYSDVSHAGVMHLASRANAAGADFLLPGARRTMLQSRVPVVAVCASRTGAGKSPAAPSCARCGTPACASACCVIRCPMATWNRSAFSASPASLTSSDIV